MKCGLEFSFLVVSSAQCSWMMIMHQVRSPDLFFGGLTLSSCIRASIYGSFHQVTPRFLSRNVRVRVDVLHAVLAFAHVCPRGLLN